MDQTVHDRVSSLCTVVCVHVNKVACLQLTVRWCCVPSIHWTMSSLYVAAAARNEGLRAILAKSYGTYRHFLTCEWHFHDLREFLFGSTGLQWLSWLRANVSINLVKKRRIFSVPRMHVKAVQISLLNRDLIWNATWYLLKQTTLQIIKSYLSMSSLLSGRFIKLFV